MVLSPLFSPAPFLRPPPSVPPSLLLFICPHQKASDKPHESEGCSFDMAQLEWLIYAYLCMYMCMLMHVHIDPCVYAHASVYSSYCICMHMCKHMIMYVYVHVY